MGSQRGSGKATAGVLCHGHRSAGAHFLRVSIIGMKTAAAIAHTVGQFKAWVSAALLLASDLAGCGPRARGAAVPGAMRTLTSSAHLTAGVEV